MEILGERAFRGIAKNHVVPALPEPTITKSGALMTIR
jgi:hypothetical protein